MANLIVEQKTIKELFQGSKCDFLIPDYQRPYEWGDEECKTLWDDLYSFSIPDNDYSKFRGDEYFLGPIVTFKNNNQMEVIDGQQRLTTLMLLLRAFYNKLINMDDTDTIEMKKDIEKCIWHSDELGKTIFSSLKIDSQVASDEDKDEFLAILRDGQWTEKKSFYAKNFIFFVNSINEFVNKRPTYFPYLPARILNNCVLLPIEAESQDTALRIFSTLNDRGKPLADSDIFKAQFYKYFSKIGEKEAFMDKWRELDKIADDVFHPIYGTPLDELFTQYMYYERALKGEKSSTVEGLRKFYEGDGTNGAYPLLRKKQTLNNLLTLAKFWQDITNQNQERFSDKVLKKLFVLNYAPNSMWKNITSVYFMSHKGGDDGLDDEKFYKFLDCITAFIWAYTVIKPGINSLRTPIFAEMVKIVNGAEGADFNEFLIAENTYRIGIENYSFINSRAITKAMLTWWAFHSEKQELLDLEKGFDIEHIYPKSRLNNEHGLSNPLSIELLGNKSLLEQRINIRASDYRFVDKKKYYKGYITGKGKEKDGTKITELIDICDSHNDFTEKDILDRNTKIIDAFVEYLRENNLLQST